MLSTNRENSEKKSAFSFLSDNKNSFGSNDCKSVQENAKLFFELKEKTNAFHNVDSCPSAFPKQLASSVACKVSNSTWASGQKRVKTRRALLGNVTRETQISNTREENFTSTFNPLTPSSLKESIHVNNAIKYVSVNELNVEEDGNNVENSLASLANDNVNSFIQKESIGCSTHSKVNHSENNLRNQLNTDTKLQLGSLSNVNSTIDSINVSRETVSFMSPACLSDKTKTAESLIKEEYMCEALSLLTKIDNFLILKKEELNELTNTCRCEENVFDVTFQRQRLMDEVNQLKIDQNEAILREDYVEADTIDQLIKQTKKKLEDFEETTCSSPFAFFVKIEEAFNDKYDESTNIIQNVLNELDTIQHTIIKEIRQKISFSKTVIEKDFENLYRDFSMVQQDYEKIKIQKEDISIQQERLKEEILKRTFIHEGTRQKAVAKKCQLDQEIDDLEYILNQKREFRQHLKSIIMKNENQIKKIEDEFKVELCELHSKENELHNAYKKVEYKRNRLITDRSLLEKQTQIFRKDVKEVTLQMGIMIITRELLRQYIIFYLNQVKPIQNALITLTKSFTNISTGCQSLSQVRQMISTAREKIELYLSIVNDLKMKQLVLQNQLDQFLKQKEQAVKLRQFRDAACFTKEIQKVTNEMESLVAQVDSNEKELNDASLTIQELEPEEHKLCGAINQFMFFAGDNIFHLLHMYRKCIGTIVNPVEEQAKNHCDKTCLPFQVFLEKLVDEYLQRLENNIHHIALQDKSKFLSPSILVKHIAKNLKSQFFHHPFMEATWKILYSFFTLFRVEEIVCDSLLMTCVQWKAQRKSNETYIKLQETALKKIQESKAKLAFLYFCNTRQGFVKFNLFDPSNANNFSNIMSQLAECIITVREMKNLFLMFALSNKENKTSFIIKPNSISEQTLVFNKPKRSQSFSYPTRYCLPILLSDGFCQQATRHPHAVLFSKASSNNIFLNFSDQQTTHLTDNMKISTYSTCNVRSLSI